MSMKSVIQSAKRFIADDKGLETVEYAIIAGIIVASTIGSVIAIGAWVGTKFSTLQGQLK